MSLSVNEARENDDKWTRFWSLINTLQKKCQFCLASEDSEHRSSCPVDYKLGSWPRKQWEEGKRHGSISQFECPDDASPEYKLGFSVGRTLYVKQEA